MAKRRLDMLLVGHTLEGLNVVGIAMIGVSFISLRPVLPVTKLLAHAGTIIALFKFRLRPAGRP